MAVTSSSSCGKIYAKHVMLLLPVFELSVTDSMSGNAHRKDQIQNTTPKTFQHSYDDPAKYYCCFVLISDNLDQFYMELLDVVMH